MKYLGLTLLSLQGALSWSLWSYVKQAEYERLGLPVITTPSPRKDTTTSKLRALYFLSNLNIESSRFYFKIKFWKKFVVLIYNYLVEPCLGGQEQQMCELQCFNEFKDCKKDCLDDSSCTQKCVKKYTDCEAGVG